MDLLHAAALAHSQDLALSADYQNVRIQDLREHGADVIKNDLAGIIVVKKLINFSGFIQ